MVADYVRNRKKPKTLLVEHISDNPIRTENHENEKKHDKHLYNPFSGLCLDNKFDNKKSSCLIETSKLVDSLFLVHKIQKLKMDIKNKTPREKHYY